MPYTVTMPKLSPTMEKGVIAKWCKKEGDLVKEGELLLEIATDKATVEHNALDKGYLRKILIKEGESASVNDPIAIFTEEQKESIEGYAPQGVVSTPQVKKEPEKSVKVAPAQTPSVSKQRLFVSPLARKIANEKGIDLSKVHGSGPNGRIVSKDLSISTRQAVPGAYDKIALSPVRKVIAQRLQESKSTIPHFYVTQKILAGRLIALREELVLHGKPVSYNDLILKAVALSLRAHPQMNSGFDGESILRFQSVDIAVAVSVPSGLITPIITGADHKDLFSISQEIKNLVTRAKEGKLRPEEYQGGSFTLSNLGMFGINEFQAIINPPQAAILAVGGLIEEPIVHHGVIAPGKTMTLTVSADHRVIDGADVAVFLQTLKKFLENPSILLA